MQFLALQEQPGSNAINDIAGLFSVARYVIGRFRIRKRHSTSDLKTATGASS